MTGRSLDEVLAALAPERQQTIDARFHELKDEVESLQALRQASGKAQAEIAASLGIKQPSVSKIERQTDMYLSTLRNYVEAIGGELDIVVRLPGHRPVRVTHLAEIAGGGRRRKETTP